VKFIYLIGVLGKGVFEIIFRKFGKLRTIGACTWNSLSRWDAYRQLEKISVYKSLNKQFFLTNGLHEILAASLESNRCSLCSLDQSLYNQQERRCHRSSCQ